MYSSCYLMIKRMQIRHFASSQKRNNSAISWVKLKGGYLQWGNKMKTWDDGVCVTATSAENESGVCVAQSTTSSHSSRSSRSSIRQKEPAERAALFTRAASLKQKQALELEESAWDWDSYCKHDVTGHPEAGFEDNQQPSWQESVKNMNTLNSHKWMTINWNMNMTYCKIMSVIIQ